VYSVFVKTKHEILKLFFEKILKNVESKRKNIYMDSKRKMGV